MNKKEKTQFQILKKKVSERFLQDFPEANSDISTWKGLYIVYFQEHLLKNVKGNVSEKWFYTYFKQEPEKLPRIDMLNLLSEYVGYKSWKHFIMENPSEQEEESNKIIEEKQLEEKHTKKISSVQKNILKWIAGIIFLVAGIFGIQEINKNNNTYTFCFYDADANSPIPSQVEITVHKKGESSKRYLADAQSCFNYTTSDDTLEMTVNSKFHKQTTFKYILNRYKEPEVIQIEPDEYALMLNYYVTSKQKIKDRQSKLRKLISNDALIYQVYDNEVYGVEVLTKEQYIGLVTLPTESLKKYIQIYSETNDKGKITKIKFKILTDEN
ncbi:MAG: hypothetical protein H6604_01665 [Flavobacteriales bacterium]|nr:hypothetical protein [Flavobacteriales bacterium]